MKIDNITLALLSIEDALKVYLDDNGWKREYTMAIAGDRKLRNKEIVERVSNPSKQIGLPLITIESGPVRNELSELGSSGNDVVTASIIIRALDHTQMITLGNTIRRKLTDLSFDIYDLTSPLKGTLGTGLSYDTILDDLSDWNADNLGERHVSLISTILEFTSQDLL